MKYRDKYEVESMHSELGRMRREAPMLAMVLFAHVDKRSIVPLNLTQLLLNGPWFLGGVLTRHYSNNCLRADD